MADERNPRMSSVLGETGVVIGNLEGIGDFEIRGRVQGMIQIEGRVLVAESGVVLGSIEATHISVLGRVQGDLIASDNVLIAALGRIEGNLTAPRIGIEAGARVRGVCRAGDDDDKSAASAPRKPPEKRGFPEKTVPSLEVETSKTSELTDESAGAQLDDGARHSANERKSPRHQGRLRPPKKTKPAGSPPHPREALPVRNTPPGARRDAQVDISAEPETGTIQKKTRRRGPPAMPTFVKGTKGHQRS